MSGSRPSGGGLRDEKPCKSVQEARSRYGPIIWGRIPAHVTGQDRGVVHNSVFVRLFKRYPTGVLPHPLLGMLCGFLTDALRDLAKERRRHRVADPPSEEPPAPSSASPERLVGREEERALVRAILREMEPEDRELVKLSYYEELTSEDIGELLGIAAANVRQKLKRARGRFAKLFEMKKAQEGKAQKGEDS